MLDNSKWTAGEPVVCIIDDEEPIRDSLLELFDAASLHAIAYENASDFLNRGKLERAGCILLDVNLPDVNGLEFQPQLAAAGSTMPVIFMSGSGDVLTGVKAMKAGATDFLLKPFAASTVLDAAKEALRRDALERQELSLRLKVADCANSLTPREREVLEYVVQGMMNKQIAYEMNISEVMVKIHRGRVVRKMEAKSIPDLVRKHILIQKK